jgi:chromosome segregation ATPase
MTKIIKSISVKNLGKFSEFTINLDRNVTYLIGPNGAGKTTVGVTGIQAALQGIAEKSMNGNVPVIGERFRFIGPAAPTAQVGVTLFDEKAGHEIRINRTITKSGTTLKIEGPEGAELTQEDLNALFNAFMINPQAFTQLSGVEQARALGIDTTDFDVRLKAEKSKFTEINAVIRSMGTLSPVAETVAVDFADLSRQKDDILEFNRQQDERQQKIQQAKQQVQDLAILREEKLNRIAELQAEIATLQGEADTLGERVDKGTAFIKTLPAAEDKKPTEGIDKQIQDANETNRKALAYQQYKEKAAQLEKKQAELSANKQDQEKIEAERIAYIKNFKFPFKNLTVDDGGNLLLDGKLIKEPYFSTGELMKIIPVLISTTKPDLQYVFIKDSNLLDDERLDEVVDFLNKKGMQLLIEVRGKKAIEGKNCILLRDQQVVTTEAGEETAALEI